MKFVIVFVALFAAVAAVPISPAPADTQIVRLESSVLPDGYSYSWETSDGSSASEQGQLKNAGGEEPSITARGQFAFVADDGQLYTVQYVADENGFQPVGAHLPVAPVA